MKKEPYQEYVVEMVVPFHDVDGMQVVWHGNYLKYFEISMAGLFKKAGFDLYEYYRTSGYIFPITKTSTRHIRPLRFNEFFFCKVKIMGYKRQIVADYEIRRKSDNTLCVTGHTEQVTVRTADFQLEFEVPKAIQDVLRGK